jgi:hypothetical protein
MIRAYVGDFGSGKTLNMVWDLMQAMYKGRKVISNTPIKLLFAPFGKKPHKIEAEFVPKGDDFLKAIAYRENCIMAIDEAAVYLPNIYWSKLPPELIVKFAQNRKYRTDFWYTTQGFGMAVKRLRELTHRVNLCWQRRFFGIPIFVSKKFKPEFFKGEPTEKKYNRYYLGQRTLYPSEYRRVFKAYDTNYVVDMSAMMKVKGFQQPSWDGKSRQESGNIRGSVSQQSKEAESNRNLENSQESESVNDDTILMNPSLTDSKQESS